MKRVNEKTTGFGTRTGVYCTPSEFEHVLEIIKEIDKTSIISVKATKDLSTVAYKKPRTQLDLFNYIRKLADKYNLPCGLYGLNQQREFIYVSDGKEEDFHKSYE